MPIDYAGLGSAAKDIFSGTGSLFEAAGYGDAAELSDKAGDIEKLSTGIKLEQATREGYKVLGATEAAAGANGLSLSGSASDILHSNAQQLSLNKNLVEQQGTIDELGYREKAAADRGAAQAAQASGAGGILGGVLGAADAIKTVICTELTRQSKIPRRWYLEGAKVSALYPAAVLEGYQLWAVPSVRHLRAHPDSAYSRFLLTIFTWYLGNIAAAAGIDGARWCWQGKAVTAIIYRLCYAVGWVRLSFNRLTDWGGIYRTR